MEQPRSAESFTRRDVLKLGGAALGSTVVGAPDLVRPAPTAAQAPRRGGVFRFPGFDPPNFDPHQNVHWYTFIYLSLTHEGLVRHKAGPGVQPNTYPIEPRLAESWKQPNDTTYVFKLRKGIRFHNKPPVNARELTAEDVVFTYHRALTIKGNPNRATFEEIDKVDALDRYTVRFTMKAPYAWFMHGPALTSILPREAADKDGTFKKAESVIGTGPWMLERYEPNVRLSFVRNPDYFQSPLPYVDAVEVRIDTDLASKMAAWLGGQYDFAPQFQHTLQRTDLEVVRRRKPNLQMAEFTFVASAFGVPNLDVDPVRDVRVRRALHMAVDPRQVADANGFSYGGHVVPNPLVPGALREWSIPIDQLTPDGRRLYQYDLEEAKRLLAQAGHAGLKLPVESTNSWGPNFSDGVQAILGEWKKAGIEAQLKLKEGNAFIASTLGRKFDKVAMVLRGDATYPDPYLVNLLPGRPRNSAGVNDPKLTDMIIQQRRTFDEKKRREIIFDIQRHFAQNAYHLFVAGSAKVLSAWEPYVKNFMPNASLDYGGRLMIAWIDK